jgi:hypothetical protein
MAGLIDVGILKPELAGSFAAGYRGAEEQRNALAQRQQQAAQAEQQLASGRQRLQMDEMTMQRMQEDRAALTGLRARLRAAGQSDDPKVFFRVLAESDDPNVMMKGIEGLQRYRALEAYDREFGPRAMAAPAMPSSAPNAMVAPEGELVAAPITAPKGTMREIAPGGGMGAEMPLAPANALAPAAPAPANALALPAAAPVNALSPAATAPNIDALRRQYGMAVAAGKPYAPVLLEQIKAALKPDPTPSELRTMQTLGYPLTQEGYAAFRAAQMRENQPRAPIAVLQNGRPVYVSPEQAVGQTPFTPASVQVLGMGPGREPAAPTIAQIVDPANPSQMITIDARRYQGGGVGSPGVLGVGGKEPGAAVRENKVEAGKTQLADDLENLRASFLVLDQKRAIPSTERGVLSNIASATAASGVGQMLGRATGTTEQVEREVINSARTRLVNSIKNATGMSAQQLNSNVELQTMLKSISDPAQPVQAALRIIEDIENAYVKGAGMPKKNAPARSLTPQDQEALNWANSNPNDPRAAQIKQRLGATK